MTRRQQLKTKGETMTYTISQAVNLLNKNGFSVNLGLNEFTGRVRITQEFTSKGEEYAVLRKARGKYRGNSIGSGWRQ